MPNVQGRLFPGSLLSPRETQNTGILLTKPTIHWSASLLQSDKTSLTFLMSQVQHLLPEGCVLHQWLASFWATESIFWFWTVESLRAFCWACSHIEWFVLFLASSMGNSFYRTFPVTVCEKVNERSYSISKLSSTCLWEPPLTWECPVSLDLLWSCSKHPSLFCLFYLCCSLPCFFYTRMPAAHSRLA